MKYTTLGNTSIQVSKLYVGCVNFGDPASQMHAQTLNPEESENLTRRALDSGTNLFDTANTYSAGTGEGYLGHAIRNSTTRDKAVLATKVCFNEGHLSKEAIIREIDDSLKWLGTDYMDPYIIHRFDYGAPTEETVETLDSLMKAEKARALGASAMHGYQFRNMQPAAEKNGQTPFSTMQNHHNLLYREDECELIPVCRQQQVSLTLCSPLAAGRLARLGWKTDTLRNRIDKTAVSKYDSTQESDHDIVLRVHEITQKYGITTTRTALAWQFVKGATAPIIDTTKTKCFDDAIGALDISLTKEDITYLEELYTPHRIVGILPPTAV